MCNSFCRCLSVWEQYMLSGQYEKDLAAGSLPASDEVLEENRVAPPPLEKNRNRGLKRMAASGSGEGTVGAWR